jgi:hypothetical protein
MEGRKDAYRGNERVWRIKKLKRFLSLSANGMQNVWQMDNLKADLKGGLDNKQYC